MFKPTATPFTLTLRKDGRYCRKMPPSGKIEYFGRDKAAAIEACRKRLEVLAAPGAFVPEAERPLSVGRLLNDFSEECEANVGLGRLKRAGFKAYQRVFEKIRAALIPDPQNVPLLADLTEKDFQRLALYLNKPDPNKPEFYAPSTRQQYLVIADMVLKFAAERRWLEPVRYRKAMASPSKKERLDYLEERGELRFSADQIQRMIDHAQGPMRAWVLVAINAAYGPYDLEKLSRKYVDLDGGWLTFPRPKTGEPRRCPLWDETRAALREFYPWESTAAQIGIAFRQLLDAIDNGTKEEPEFPREIESSPGRMIAVGWGHYTLRRTFAIVASEVAPDHVVKRITGHSDSAGNMLGTYRQGAVADHLLKTCVDHVHDWVYSGQNS